MSRNNPIDSCRKFQYQMCDEVADIVNHEQAKFIAKGRFIGRNRIIDLMIIRFRQANLSLSDLGTDSRDTGSI